MPANKRAGMCRNCLMICLLTATGLADNEAHTVANMSLHSIGLHYKRPSQKGEHVVALFP